MLRLAIENFQSVRAMQEVPLNGITLLYGNNSSGKSVIKDALIVGAEMEVGPANNPPKDEWINVHALEQGEPVKLSYLFFLGQLASLPEKTFITHLIAESLLTGDQIDASSINTDDEGVAALTNYLANAVIDVEYSWPAEAFFSPVLECDVTASLRLGLPGSADSIALDLLAEVTFEHEGRVIVEFNEAHELIKITRKWLDESTFIDGESLECFQLCGSEYDDESPLIERYRWAKQAGWGLDEPDLGFLLTFFCVAGAHLCVSKASRIAFVGDVREPFEEKRGDTYRGSEYWSELKRSVLQDQLGFDSFMGELERINKWLCGKEYLDSGYELSAEFKFLVSLSDLKDAEGFDSRTHLLEVIDQNGLDYSKLMLKDKHTARLVDFSDVGTGISQVMPILHQMAKSGFFGSAVYVQQPELHLHPKLQASMAQIFIESFITNNKSRSYIIETHSELLVLRMLKVIRQNYETRNLLKPRALLADDVNVIFSVKDNNGITTYKNLRISKNGDFLDKWPEGFFEERDQELF